MVAKHLKPLLVPYENSLYDLLVNKTTGKYFQHKLATHLIAHFPEKAGIHLIENNQLSAWFPLTKKWGDIDLKEFDLYVEISKEQFEKYKIQKTDLSNILLAHKDAQIFKEDNKANLNEGKPNLPGHPEP